MLLFFMKHDIWIGDKMLPIRIVGFLTLIFI